MYYFYESPELNHDFNYSKIKAKGTARKSPTKPTSVTTVVKRAIRKIEQAQLYLLSVTSQLPMQKSIAMLQLHRKHLQDSIGITDNDDLYASDDYCKLEMEADEMHAAIEDVECGFENETNI